MIRATVILYSVDQLQDAYLSIQQIPNLKILKVKNKMDTELENISILFMYREGIIGEVQVRYNEKPPNYYANHFIYELERSDSAQQF